MGRQIPDWVAANPVIMGLLEYVLEKRDKQVLLRQVKPIAITLIPQKASRALRAALAPFSDPSHDDGLLWDELKWLSTEYRCFTIKPSARPKPGRAPWEGARLYFEDSREAFIREWLQRPRPVEVNQRWRAALTQFVERFENMEAFPPEGLVLDAGFKNFEMLLGCWASVGEVLDCTNGLSWRQLSARSFFGDSKYLDGEARRSLVRALFPSRSGRIHERPLLMHLYLPAQPERVLLIENQDSFLMLAECEPEDMALVYIEGYRGGAARVRAVGVTRFSTVNNASSAQRRDFLQWWQGQASKELPVYFWGDLDFEGMHIAAALRRSFLNLVCWRPGYEALLSRLEAGAGHLPQQAKKDGQRLIESTGCEYADLRLIPSLRKIGRFVDQEAVFAQELLGAVNSTSS